MRRLLIRPGAIGDLILSLPALQYLKTDYTEVWCAEQNVALVRFADRVQSIIGAGLDRVTVLSADDVLEQLGTFDEIHSWYGTRHEEFREAVAALPFRFHAPLPTGGSEHATDFYCRQVGAPVRYPCISIGDVAKRRDFAVLHPFASNAAKRWPLEKFRELARHLDSPVWCAGPNEELAGAHRVADLFDLASWIGRARVYIGNDSGITHLAAAVGTPTIALFGPTNPAIWAPRGLHVRVVVGNPLSDVSIEEVLVALATLL